MNEYESRRAFPCQHIAEPLAWDKEISNLNKTSTRRASSYDRTRFKQDETGRSTGQCEGNAWERSRHEWGPSVHEGLTFHYIGA